MTYTRLSVINLCNHDISNQSINRAFISDSEAHKSIRSSATAEIARDAASIDTKTVRMTLSDLKWPFHASRVISAYYILSPWWDEIDFCCFMCHSMMGLTRCYTRAHQEMRYPNVTRCTGIILSRPIYLFTTEIRHTCTSGIFLIRLNAYLLHRPI